MCHLKTQINIHQAGQYVKKWLLYYSLLPLLRSVRSAKRTSD